MYFASNVFQIVNGRHLLILESKYRTILIKNYKRILYAFNDNEYVTGTNVFLLSLQ